MTDKPIESSKLCVGVLQKTDLAGITTDVLTLTMDTNESQNQVNQLISDLTNTLTNAQDFDKNCLLDGYAILKKASGRFVGGFSLLAQWSRLAALAKKGNLSAAATVFNQRLDLLAQNYHVDFWSRILYDMPEQYAQKLVTKYYNKAFAIEDPDERTQFILASYGLETPEDYLKKYTEDMGFSEAIAKNVIKVRQNQWGMPDLGTALILEAAGQWSKDDVTNLLRLGQGASAVHATQMHDVANWQTGVPSLREAWVMVQRGLWAKTDWMQLATLGHGFPANDAEAYYSLMNYDPSLGDVMSLSNIIPLEPAWVAQKLARTGMSTDDQNLFIAAINKKVILQEIRGFWATIMSQYSYGGFSQVELNGLLTNWKFTQAEIDIKLATAELMKQKTVNGLMRDADIYLYRTGTIVEYNGANGLYDRLLAQALPPEVANAIVRNEVAKKGTDWELPE